MSGGLLAPPRDDASGTGPEASLIHQADCGDDFRRRRARIPPTRPVLSSERLAGSGTQVGETPVTRMTASLKSVSPPPNRSSNATTAVSGPVQSTLAWILLSGF